MGDCVERMHSDRSMLCEQGIIMQTMYSGGVQRVMVRRADASMFMTQRATNFRKVRANTPGDPALASANAARGRQRRVAKKKARQRRMQKEKHRTVAQSAVAFGSLFQKVRTRKLGASLFVARTVSLVVGGPVLLPLI